MARLVVYSSWHKYLFHLFSGVITAGIYFILRYKFPDFLAVADQVEGGALIFILPPFLLLELIHYVRSIGLNISVTNEEIQVVGKKFSIKKIDISDFVAKTVSGKYQHTYSVIISLKTGEEYMYDKLTDKDLLKFAQALHKYNYPLLTGVSLDNLEQAQQKEKIWNSIKIKPSFIIKIGVITLFVTAIAFGIAVTIALYYEK